MRPSGLQLLARCNTLQGSGLFYASKHGWASDVTWADTPARVITAVGGSWRLDQDWLIGWVLGTAEVKGTPFHGLYRLLPGQELWQDTNGALMVRETVGPDVWPEPDLTGEDAERALVEAIDAAVADLAGGQSLVACELSGGLDSSFVVSSLAGNDSGVEEIRAFTHVPSPEAVLRPGNWVASDSAAARLIAEKCGSRVHWSELYNVTRRGPLEWAQQVSSRAWWPVFGPANLEWISAIRGKAAEAGANKVWVGTHGNAAFSVNYTYDIAPTMPSPLQRARRSARRRFARRGQGHGPGHGQTHGPGSFLRQPVSRSAPLTRRGYLHWLAGHRGVHSALLNPDAFAVDQVDPFRHPLVLETAARIRPEGWRRPGLTRGLARSAGRGRIPDEVRFRVARGAQGLDVWHWMFQRRSDYFLELEALSDIDWLAEVIDVDAVRLAMRRWPWGHPEPPSLAEVRVITRYLALGRFVRDMGTRLPVAGPPS